MGESEVDVFCLNFWSEEETSKQVVLDSNGKNT